MSCYPVRSVFGSASVGADATKIADANPNRVRIRLQKQSAAGTKVVLGNNSSMGTTGFELGGLTEFVTTGEIWGRKDGVESAVQVAFVDEVREVF